MAKQGIGSRAEYMTNAQHAAIAAHIRVYRNTARTHTNMLEACGVARPGKTAKDRAQGSINSTATGRRNIFKQAGSSKGKKDHDNE